MDRLKHEQRSVKALAADFIKGNIKNIVLVMVFCSVMLFNPLAFAESGTPVDITESDTSIDIYLNISFSGELADEYFPDTHITYSDAFIHGIKYVWNGTYNKKPVIIHITKSDNNSIGSVQVNINPVKTAYNYSRAMFGLKRVYMFNGDGRTGEVYDYVTFLYTSGHEIGHILGLDDVYDDKNVNVRKFLASPMRDRRTPHASAADYYALLTNKTWLRNEVFSYSSDRILLLRYLPM